MIRILYFGRVSEAAGASSIDIDLPGGVADTGALRAWLAETVPELEDPSVRVALNHDLVTKDCAIVAGDEIAFFPPVSGG